MPQATSASWCSSLMTSRAQKNTSFRKTTLSADHRGADAAGSEAVNQLNPRTPCTQNAREVSRCGAGARSGELCQQLAAAAALRAMQKQEVS